MPPNERRTLKGKGLACIRSKKKFIIIHTKDKLDNNNLIIFLKRSNTGKTGLDILKTTGV